MTTFTKEDREAAEKAMASAHSPECPAFCIGDMVVALVDLVNDLRDEGMGVQCCAHKGDELVVRKVYFGFLNCISVSHAHVTDRSFCVAPNEISIITKNNL